MDLIERFHYEKDHKGIPHLLWRCPSCAKTHGIPVKDSKFDFYSGFSWDGNVVRPTVDEKIVFLVPGFGKCQFYLRNGRYEKVYE